MTDDSVRKALMNLPVASVPAELTARLRVIASHERQRRISRFRWLDNLWLDFNNLMRPLAVPATGGLLCSVVLFGSLVDTFNVQRYINKDVPLGIYTAVTVDELSPFPGGSGDLMVEVTIDSKGRVCDFSIPNGTINQDQLKEIGNLLLYSTFTPATAYGQPVTGKILLELHRINVRG